MTQILHEISWNISHPSPWNSLLPYGLFFQVFESVEEVDQIETEPKNEEVKQTPKMPNGALQNETNSPDSGHPSSRNFSVTSGLSDGSLSTEDSTAPDTSQRSAAAPLASETPVKPAGVESEGLTEDKGEAKKKPPTENTKTEVVQQLEETSLQTERQDKAEDSKAFDTEGTKIADKSQDTNIKGIKSLESEEKGKQVSGGDSLTVSAATTETKQAVIDPSVKKEADLSSEETSKMAETNVKKTKEMDESKTLMEQKERISVHTVASEVEKNLVLSGDIRVSGARETCYYAPQKDEAQVMTESDESPSAIEMEEIPKAKVSMVPWSRKEHCGTSSSSEDSAPDMELRQEEQGKPSPEGTESVLSEEPEMESLYPHFDSMVSSGNTKAEATSQESAGSTFSVRTHFLSV